MTLAILLLAVGFVAFTNGANANFKGVASLYGSGTTTLRTAALGNCDDLRGLDRCTFLGPGHAQFVQWPGGCSRRVGGVSRLRLRVALGAALTSFLANRFGFPVSTTHALVGGLLGAGLAGSGEVRFAVLGKLFFFPLFFSPIVAAVSGALVYLVLKSLRLLPDHRTPVLDVLHFLSTGAASFARGLNDTPKMAALMLLVPGLEAHWGFLIVALAIAAGGLLDIDRVAETLGKKITGMSPGQGYAVSLVTAGLVTTASLHSLPVSTTHVSVGALRNGCRLQASLLAKSR